MKRNGMVMVLAAGLSMASLAQAATEAQIVEGYGHLPLSFETNTGQTDERVNFISRGQAYTLYLTPTEAVLALHKGAGRPSPTELRRDRSAPPSEVVRMTVLDGNPQATTVATERLPGTVNYFVGNDPTRWRNNLPLYARASYGCVYRGVDLTYYGTQGRLEYDFAVAPGTDPRVITLAFDGVRQTRIDPSGELVLRTTGGEVRFHKPLTYQSHDGQQQEVASRYVMKGKDRVGFLVAAYDRHRPLVIDPVLVYSTYLGGNVGDEGNGIAVDAAGNAYVTGLTSSTDFPTRNAFQSALGGVYAQNAFVTKLGGPGGSNLVYSTYLGGNNIDYGSGIAVDAAGNAYVTGYTDSTNFPTRNAFQSALSSPYAANAFVTKLGPGGSNLVYSTYLGGNYFDSGSGIAVDAAGSAYVTGNTYSTNFPTRNAFQSGLGGANGNAFVTKLAPSGSNVVYSTYLGGSGQTNIQIYEYGDSGYGIAVDGAGNAYVTGQTYSTNFPTRNAFQSAPGGTNGNAFVTELGPGGSNLVYSTYLGGSGQTIIVVQEYGDEEVGDSGSSIAVDGAGDAYVTGQTYSTNFPTRNAFQSAPGGTNGNAFVMELGPGGSNLVYSTYLGGNNQDSGVGIAVDGAGNAYVTGYTDSTNFPTRNAFQSTLGGGANAFVTKLGSGGSNLVYSTYLGGTYDMGVGIAVDATGNAYVTGYTDSTNFPTRNAFQSGPSNANGSAFVTKIGGLGSVLSIVAIALETNEVSVTWTTAGGESYVLQTNTPPADGSYFNTFADFSPVMTAPGSGVSTTNYVDNGAVTNFTARYYRVRLVP